MPRKKQRENYGNGSVSPVMVTKTDDDGNTTKVQKRDKKGRLTWRVCVSLGTEEYTDEDGNPRKRQRKVQKTVHGSVADARKLAKQLTDAYEDIDPESAGMTFDALVDAWEKSMQTAGNIGVKTLSQHMQHLGYMRQHVGSMQIIDVRQRDIESALAKIKSARGLSGTSMNRIFAVTKRVFTYAMNNDWIVRNPCARMDAPKMNRAVDRRSLSLEEVARLRACLDRDEEAAYSVFAEKEQRQTDWGNLFNRSYVRGVADIVGVLGVRIMLATGMRRGEALGLSWDCVDFERGQIVVRWSLNDRVERKEPKTAAGVRTINLEADTMQHLRRWKDKQASILQRIKVKQTDKTPVLNDSVGTWYDPTNFYRWWNGYRETIGFPTLKLHELRHTQATLLLGNGADVKTVQARLGHANASITLNQYAHAIPANDRAAADLFGQIMSQPAKAQADVKTLRAAG